MSSLYRATISLEDVYAPTRPPKLKVPRGVRDPRRLFHGLMRFGSRSSWLLVTTQPAQPRKDGSRSGSPERSARPHEPGLPLNPDQLADLIAARKAQRTGSGSGSLSKKIGAKLAQAAATPPPLLPSTNGNERAVPAGAQAPPATPPAIAGLPPPNLAALSNRPTAAALRAPTKPGEVTVVMHKAATQSLGLDIRVTPSAGAAGAKRFQGGLTLP